MSWPADPSWAYADGAGALFEMGVYGITEVTGILGPAKRVISMSTITPPPLDRAEHPTEIVTEQANLSSSRMRHLPG